MIKTQEGTKQVDFFNNIFTLYFIARFERVVQSLHVRGSWRPNINFIFWPPLLMTVTLCLSCSLVLFNRSPRAHSAGCWLSLLHLISIFSGPQLIKDSRPIGLVGLSLPHLSGILLATALAPNSTQLYNNSTPTRSLTGSLKSNV